MIQTARDLAEAALGTLRMAEAAAAAGDTEGSSRLELAAALMANHIGEWHYASQGIDYLAGGKAAFERAFPEAATLRAIANGFKHPLRHRGRTTAVQDVEWEHADFWHAPHTRPTLFVEVEGRQRSVCALTLRVCEQYLEEAARLDRP